MGDDMRIQAERSIYAVQLYVVKMFEMAIKINQVNAKHEGMIN